MHTITLLTSFLALASAAPSDHGHTIAHRRRDRFISRHAHRVRQLTGREPAVHDMAAHNSHTHHAPFVQTTNTRPSNSISDPEETEVNSDCLIHQPFLAASRQPTASAHTPSTCQIDYSGNWCGIVQNQAASNGSSSALPFQAVSASWVMPTLAAPSNSGSSSSDTTFYGSQWVGIDGYNYGGAILQAGTTSAVTISANGSAVNSASAWFEWFPDPESPISESDLAVSPGDTIWCEVRAINTTAGTVTLINMSTGQNFSQVFGAPNEDAGLKGVNAEWIYEDFSSGGLVPFASFTPVTFENCTAETSDGSSVGVEGGTVVDLADGNDVLCNAAVVDGASLKVAYGPAS